ncbi:Accumulation of dyads protein 2 [Candida viswanathii]|uniref:Accumulation of dyads protein 2 n=1 Tax=Candida viswanathii TaxID=5486 RepID=A0A367YKZ4_9ASCO|nr:Accumulation of dyads protein 2 [Candida viswanathii]
MSTSESISSEIKPYLAAEQLEYTGTQPEPAHRTCSIAGDGGEFVIIGDHKYYRHELMQAFGGALNPGLAPYPKHGFGNPAPIGMIATCMNILVLGLYFARAKGIETTNVAVSLCMFMGGLVQYLAGIWGFFVGSQAGAFTFIVFTSYGAFWFSFGAVFIPAFGIQEAYADDPAQLNQAIGLMSVGWVIFTTMIFVCTWKSTVSLAWALGTLDLTIILFAAGFLLDSVTVRKAAGIVGVIHAFSGWYEAFSGTCSPTNSYWVPKEIPLPDFSKMLKRKK